MRRYFRAYPAISSRQQGADRLVYNETDLRTVLWQAVDPKFEGVRPSTIRLAADIYLTKPIELGAYQYNVSIEGAGKFAIAESQSFSGTYLFGLPDGTISDIDFSAIKIELITVALLFSGSSLSTVRDFGFQECSLTLGLPTQMFHQDVDVLSTIVDLDDYPPAHSFILGPGIFGGSGTFTGIFSVGSHLSQWESLVPIFVRNDVGVGCRTDNPALALDVDGGFAVRQTSVTLENLNPLITVGNRTTIQISINNATATGDIQLTNGTAGQVLILYFTNTSSSLRLSDGGNIDTNKNHHSKLPLAHETVTFIWLNGKWREIARSENT